MRKPLLVVQLVKVYTKIKRILIIFLMRHSKPQDPDPKLAGYAASCLLYDEYTPAAPVFLLDIEIWKTSLLIPLFGCQPSAFISGLWIRIRINLICWIRIRFRILNTDPDPGGRK